MTQVLKFVMQIPSKDAVTDEVSNSFVFESDTATDYTGIGYIASHIENFYNATAVGATNPIKHYLSTVLDQTTNHALWTAYDITAHLDGTPHGSPIGAGNWTLGSTGASEDYPDGVAATVSFRAAYGTDVEFGTGTRPRARDRNRFYVGPLNVSAFLTDDTTGRCKFQSQFLTDALAALLALSDSVTAGSWEYNLRVWSRKNASVKIPVEGWMDDRPDYQRRRSDPNPGSKVFQALAAT